MTGNYARKGLQSAKENASLGLSSCSMTFPFYKKGLRLIFFSFLFRSCIKPGELCV